MASRTRATHTSEPAAATWWSRWRDGQAGATATEYIVLVGVIGLAIVGGAAALQAGTTTAVESQSDTIGTSPQFAQMPEGSGGPATNPGIPIPPPPAPDPGPSDPDPTDPDPDPDLPDPDPDPDPQPDPDPDPEPPAPTVAFLGNLTETRETTGNRWQATVYLEVTNASQVTLSYNPTGTGSGTVTCTVSNSRCIADAGNWRTPGPGQGGGQQGVDSVVFTVVSIDGQPPGPGQGTTLTVTWP